MAKRYTATVQLNVRKQHTCASCGCVYSYILNRKVSGRGGSPEAAQANLKNQYAVTARDENDMHPCPNCGQYQPDMIGLRLARRRKWVAFVAFVPPILIPVLCVTYALQTNILAWIACFYCAAILLVQLLLSLSNPNRNREANRDLAANHLVKGTILVKPMTNTREMPDQNTPAFPHQMQSFRFIISIGILAAAVIVAAAPETLRAAMGWPLNSDCYPPVVGPGDTTRFYLNDSITSIKGYWRGTPKVAGHITGEKTPVTIAARTNQNDWGDSIEAKSEEKDQTSHPWVELTLPDDAALAGKQIDCHIDLLVEFPQIMGSNQFTSEKKQVGGDVTIHLAGPGSGASYSGTWWTCITGSLVAVFVACLLLVFAAGAYKRLAKPAEILPATPA